MSFTPSEVYLQSIDKQRIVVTGKSKSAITELIIFVLGYYQRKFDFVIDGKYQITDAPVIIIAADGQASQWVDYKHHFAVMSAHDGDASLEPLQRFADATPKSGTIVFLAADASIQAIGSRERTDVTAVPYTPYSHEVEKSKTLLITSKNEKIPIPFSGIENLLNISAAKEVLKRIGITSGQFYEAIARFN